MLKIQKKILTGLKFIYSLIDRSLALVSIFFVRIYQLLLSPDKSIFFKWLKGSICCHHPHCSQYSIEVFKKYGFFIGLRKTMDRISRCGPSSKINYDPSVHKVVFFSSAPIGVPFLEKLMLDKNFDVVGVVTMPDKPVGRGHKMQQNIIKKTYLRYIEKSNNQKKTSKKAFLSESSSDLSDFSVKTPTKINPAKSPEGKEFHDWLVSLDADWFVVIAYGKIMPTKILDLPKIMPLNIHGSLLPQYRGASPIQSVFLDHKKLEDKLQTGVTLIKMVKKMDAGPMLGKLIFNIPLNRTSLDIIETMQKKGPDFLVRQMTNWTKGFINMEEQNLDDVSFCKKFEKSDGEINPWSDNLLEIYNKYRAFYLRPKIYFILSNGKRIVIESLKINTDLLNETCRDTKLPCPNSDICKKNIKKSLFLDKNELNPIIKEIFLKPEGKGKMDWKSFKNGYLK